MTVMKKIKVAEATPKQLNWLTAKVEEVKIRWDADLEVFIYFDREEGGERDWNPVEDGNQAMAIIEIEIQSLIKARIDTNTVEWEAVGWNDDYGYGPTASIAALRCSLVSKLGDEVEVPDELCT